VVARVELASTGVGINGVRDLVVATLVEAAEIEPYFRNVRVDPDSARICVQCIPELIDLEIQDADRTPERWVASVTINSLLIGFVGLVVLLASHISTTEEIPALSIGRISFEALRETLNGKFLVLERRPILMIEPTKLLKNLGMAGIIGNNAFVCIFGTDMVFLLFIHVANLEPDVRMCERTGRISEYTVEAGEGLLVFGLLFIDYAEAEEDLVCLVEI
jgi:hypothetical protein